MIRRARVSEAVRTAAAVGDTRSVAHWLQRFERGRGAVLVADKLGADIALADHGAGTDHGGRSIAVRTDLHLAAHEKEELVDGFALATELAVVRVDLRRQQAARLLELLAVQSTEPAPQRSQSPVATSSELAAAPESSQHGTDSS